MRMRRGANSPDIQSARSVREAGQGLSQVNPLVPLEARLTSSLAFEVWSLSLAAVDKPVEGSPTVQRVIQAPCGICHGVCYPTVFCPLLPGNQFLQVLGCEF